MKALLTICMIVAATSAWADEHATSIAPQTALVVKGKVVEVKEVENYTYLRLKSTDGETWAAVPKVYVKEGAEVTITNISIMNDFESKTLKMTFPTILFGALGSTERAAPASHVIGSAFLPAHSSKAKTVADAHIIPKASGKNAYTVAEIINQGAKLKDKPVLLKARVVKFNAEIMGKNWLHLRDGSGSAADNNNDILMTGKRKANIGDIVTVKAIVRTDQDFGSGYSYKVLIEEAM